MRTLATILRIRTAGAAALTGVLLTLSASVWAVPARAETPEPYPTHAYTPADPDQPTKPAPPAETEEPDATKPAPEPTQTPAEPSPAPTTAAPTATAEVTPEATVTVTATPESPSAAPVPPASGVLPAVPPVWVQAQDHPDLLSWLIAAVVLIAGATLVILLARRPDPRAAWLPEPTPTASFGSADPEAGLASMEAVGEAMIDAGYSVTGIHSTLTDMAAVNGYPATEIVVFPTALFVSARGLGKVSTGAVSSGHRSLRFNQIDALDDVVYAARSRPSDPAEITAAVQSVRTLPPPYSISQRVVAYALLSASLSVLLGGSWTGVGVATVLGALVGVVLMLTQEVQRQYQALITVGLAFGVSVVVFTLVQLGYDPGVLAALIAPLVTFLPGGLLTTGVIELATGQMMAGAGRLAAGSMQLVLMAAGVVAGASLVGVPKLELYEAQDPIGALGPWLAVAIFGISTVIYRCGRPRSIPWILLVLYVAYGAQVLGDIFFGGMLSALVGAFAMTPVAYLVSRQRSGPAAFASFLPAFWMLVPGALGLVGVAALLDGDSAGLTALVTTVSTMVAIMLGILAGSALGNRLTGDGTVAAV